MTLTVKHRSKVKATRLSIRNPAFQKRIRGKSRSQMLGVSIDVSKDFHRVLIFDFHGKILAKPFSVDVFEFGYKLFKRKVDQYAKRINAKRIFIGIELAGSYGQSFARRMHEDFTDILFIQGSSTAANRLQKRLVGLKTDDIDCCNIGDLLIRGEGSPYGLHDGVYLDLRERAYWCYTKRKWLRKVKQQVLHRFERVYPGMSSRYDGHRPVSVVPFVSGVPRAIMRLALPPHELRQYSVYELMDLMKLKRAPSQVNQAKRFREYLHYMTWTDLQVAQSQLEPLKRDVRILEMLEQQIVETEDEMVQLVQQTPAAIILGKIKGLSDLLIANYIAFVGDITKFNSAGQIYSLSGLSPRVDESGMRKGKRRGIKRAGNRALRATLYMMALLTAKHEPYFRNYLRQYKQNHQKPFKQCIIATANKLNRVIFSLIRNQQIFEPNSQESGRPAIS